jgi:hypothetical protein
VLRFLTALAGGGIVIVENGNKVSVIHRGGILEFAIDPGKVVVQAIAIKR